MITAITAFIPIPNHPRSAEEYHELGRRLLAVDGRVLFVEGDLERCWLYRYLRERYSDPSEFSYSVADNPQKNSLAYHVVQAQKTELLVAAALSDPSDVFAWIDFGIFHIPGVTAAIISNFLHRAENEQAIAIPGCWERDEYPYDDAWPCWRFCGGTWIVPRDYVERLHLAMQDEYIRGLESTGNISWEVNVLSRVEKRHPELPLWWYRADHDKTMFTNYRATEHADGQQTQAVRGLESRYF